MGNGKFSESRSHLAKSRALSLSLGLAVAHLVVPNVARAQPTHPVLVAASSEIPRFYEPAKSPERLARDGLLQQIVAQFERGELTFEEAAARLVWTGHYNTHTAAEAFLKTEVIPKLISRQEALEKEIDSRKSDLLRVRHVLSQLSRNEPLRAFEVESRATVSPQMDIPKEGTVSAVSPNAEDSALTTNTVVSHGSIALRAERDSRAARTSPTWYLEVNPAHLLVGGFGIESEVQLNESWGMGLQAEYQHQSLYNDGGVRAQHSFYGGSPVLRFYPWQRMSGIFLGSKVLVGRSTAVIADSAVSTQYSNTLVAPIAHFGYRFPNTETFVFSAYLGGGTFLKMPHLKAEHLAPQVQGNYHWQKSRDRINKAQNNFRADFGITIGVAI